MKKLLLTITSFFLMIWHVALSQLTDESGVIYCEQFGISRPLRELAQENPANLKKIAREKKREVIRESKDRKSRKPQHFEFNIDQNGSAYGNDSSLFQTIMGTRKAPAQRINIAGQALNGARPMDPSGAVGSNHYVQMINATTIRVYNKSTGAAIGNAVTLGTLWNPDLSVNDGDPIVMYDRYADRWFLAQFGVTGNKIYIAISTTNDPSGTYYTYTFSSSQFPDYLKFSTWHDGYYMTSNQSPQIVFAFERSAMLAGNPGSRVVYKTFNPPGSSTQSFFCPLTADADGNGGLPSSGACPIFSYSDNAWGTGIIDGIQIYQMAVNWTSSLPTASITFVQSIQTDAFDASYDSNWNDIAQPGTSKKLDGIGGVLTYRAQYRKWDGYNTIVLNWGVKISSSQRSIMWAELRQNQSNGLWSIYQQQIYCPDNYYRWVGSIAMDDFGNIALCYVKSGSSTVYPSCAYTGRLATDELNKMTFAETIAAAGSASWTSSGNRFGDYSQTTLDPDGRTFWHTSEYSGTSGSTMRTRIYSFQLASSTDALVAISSSSTSVCSGSPITFTATPTNGGANPTYQWYVGGVPVQSATSSTFTSSSLTNASSVYCVLTSSDASVTNNPATSNSITIAVNNPITPSLTISGDNTICSGASTTFSATAVNGGSSPSYQWQVNGTNVGTNSTYTSNSLTNGSTVRCILTSSSTCVTTPNTTSNSLTMSVSASPSTPTISYSGGVLTSSSASGNQWYFNGSAISGATSQMHNPTQNGNYTVIVTSNGCPSAASSVYSITGLGIEELNIYQLSVYPNPSQGDFNISFNATITESYTIKVHDEVGKVVYAENIENQNGQYFKEVKLGKVSSGIYNVTLSNGANDVTRKIVVKK